MPKALHSLCGGGGEHPHPVATDNPTSRVQFPGSHFLLLCPQSYNSPELTHNQASSTKSGCAVPFTRNQLFKKPLFQSPGKGKGKGKGRPRTCHEGPEGEYRFISTLSLTSALVGGRWSTLRPGSFTHGKETRYTLYRRPGGP